MAASLTDEQLATRVRDGLAGFRPRYEEWRPFAIELHARFEARKNERPQPEIRGCRTWGRFCTKVLGYSARHVRRLMQDDGNPAAKYRNKTQHRREMRGSEPPAIATAVIPSLEWSDEKIINTGIRLIESLLRPFEGLDPQRFRRLALGIAKGIAEDFLQSDEST